MAIKLLKEIHLSELRFTPELVKSFLRESQDVKHLYNNKFSLKHVKNAIEIKEKLETDRTVLVDVLKRQYAAINSSAAVKQNIELLKEKNTFTITAAHQPCLFIGPLYNLIKISATITAAQKCKEQYPEYNFVPVFWLGSEDHDKEELCHTYLGLNKIEWHTEQSGAVGKFSLSAMEKALDELIHADAIKTELADLIKRSIADNRNFGQLTQSLVNGIFQEFGLVVLDQNEKEFKKLFIPIIQDEMQHSRVNEVLHPSIEWLEKNYHAQAKPREINFFQLKENSRERILKSGDEYLNTKGELISDTKEISNFIEQHPEQISPNVMTRPLLQEMVLPNICFIGGAAEISYWLEQKPLFDFYNVAFPMLGQRPIVIPLKKPQLQKMEKLGLSFESLVEEKNIVINQWTNTNASTSLDTTVEKLEVEKIFYPLLERAISIDKTLESSVKSELQKTLNSIDTIQSKMTKAEKRNQETALTQINNLFNTVFPDGALAERRENSLAFSSKWSSEDFKSFVSMMNPLHESLIFIEIE
jgi:bacillithiol biosynthesis cysteine-adding enzyme BshC